jgi:uncharacterized membrane protein YgcG
VADPSHHLKPATVDSLNALISALSRETRAEIAVAVVDSTSGFEPFDVALALHRMWGVGQKGRDNGIVVLWVPTQRAVQISVGYGLEGVLPDARAGRVRDQTIFPAFKRGEFDAGMLAGVDAIATIVREEKDARGSTMSTTNPPPNGQRAVERETGPSVGRRKGVIVGGAVGGGVALLGAAAGAARYRRRRPRRCPRGHGPMLRLDETADDAHLDSGQQLEEKARERRLRRLGLPDVSVCAHDPASGVVQPLLHLQVVPAANAGDRHAHADPGHDVAFGHPAGDRAMPELRMDAHVHAGDSAHLAEFRELRFRR